MRSLLRLTEQLAQNIVNKMMDVIPYNVNIMNSQGIIIGSGDVRRIGKIHEGAVKAIALKKLISIHEDRGDAKPGVNMPIYFKNEIMGVIGISGDPDIVSQFAAIVNVTAELLINQEYIFIKERSKEQLKEEILYQWVFLNEAYEESFIKRAASIGIDLNIPRRAVVVSSKNSKKIIIDRLKSYINDNEYVIRINPQDMVLFLKEDKRLNYRIKEIHKSFSENAIIGVGTEQKIMAKCVQEALRGIEIIKKLNISMDLVEYSNIISIDALSNISYKEKYFNIIKSLQEEGKGPELVKTLLSFIEHNGEMNSVANDLHIHRNSLNYRMQKIQDITGKNPKNFMDLLELFTALVVFNVNS